MNIPTETEWRTEPWDLDIPNAYKHFSGKSLEEAFELFVDNSLFYQEDIMFMPLPCFRFYVMAYANYLLSDQSKDDSDGASCFFGIVECRRDDIQSSPEQLIAHIICTLEKLRENQEWFDAEEDIYGSFRARSETCLKQIKVTEQGACTQPSVAKAPSGE